MRADSPIAFVPQLGATLITTRDDIAVCEKNVAVFSSDQPGGLMNVLMGQNMMRRDGAEHQAERNVYYPAMSPQAVRDVWAAQFAEHAARILDALIEQRSSGEADVVDLVSTYAMPVSGEALKSMTGLTNITYADMDGWSQAMIDGISNYTGDSDRESRCRDATAAIDAAIDEMLPSALRDPGHDLLSVMVASGMPLENVTGNKSAYFTAGRIEQRFRIDTPAKRFKFRMAHRSQHSLHTKMYSRIVVYPPGPTSCNNANQFSNNHNYNSPTLGQWVLRAQGWSGSSPQSFKYTPWRYTPNTNTFLFYDALDIAVQVWTPAVGATRIDNFMINTLN